jgi:diguanylate cyclase (GGDEF)-like protein
LTKKGPEQRCGRAPESASADPMPGDCWELETDTDRYSVPGHEPDEKTSYSCLVVLSGNQFGQVLTLREGQQRLGRAEDAEISLHDNSVSRYHALVEVRADHSCEIVDLGSTNGTLVNGAPIQRCVLNDRDRIQIGRMILLKLDYHGRSEEDFHAHFFQAGTHDRLTRLFNRFFFEGHLEADFRLAVRHEEELSLVVFDVDHFKSINDNAGHLAGDAALRKVADVIGGRIRGEDILARYGGDEFVLILRRTPLVGATTLATSVCARVRDALISYHETTFHFTISAGIATQSADTPYESWTALFEAADRALLLAKELGRDRVEVAQNEAKAALA